MKNLITMTANNFPETKHKRADLIRMVGSSRCDTALTLNFNRNISIDNARKMFGQLMREIDKSVRGKYFYKVPSDKRVLAFAFPEHTESNIHLHVAIAIGFTKLGKPKHETISVIKKGWSEITKDSGSVCIKETCDNGWANYITKEYHRSNHDIILSSDFHPDNQMKKWKDNKAA